MTTTADRSPAAADADPADWAGRARGLHPSIADAARDPERHQLGLPESTVEAFHRDGLWRALVPREVGGGQCGVRPAFELIEEVSRADGSAGWVLMAGLTTLAIAGAFLGDEAVAEVFADPRAVTAGQVAPLGKARRVDGGLEVEGRFGFSSGSQHATWMFGGFREQGADGPVRLGNGMPNVIAALVPKSQVELLGNWDVLGLQHTYSEDYRVPAQVVPESFTFPVFVGRPLRGGPGYDIGVNGLTCIAHAGWACGVARRALDELASVLAGHPTRKALLADSHFQHEYALAEAGLRAARSYVLESLTGLEDAALAGAVTLQQRGAARLATSHACTQAVRAVAFAYGYSGQIGLRRGVLQQCYLDISAGEQHIFTDHNSVITAGKVLLGQASPEMFF